MATRRRSRRDKAENEERAPRRRSERTGRSKPESNTGRSKPRRRHNPFAGTGDAKRDKKIFLTEGQYVLRLNSASDLLCDVAKGKNKGQTFATAKFEVVEASGKNALKVGTVVTYTRLLNGDRAFQEIHELADALLPDGLPEDSDEADDAVLELWDCGQEDGNTKLAKQIKGRLIDCDVQRRETDNGTYDNPHFSVHDPDAEDDEYDDEYDDDEYDDDDDDEYDDEYDD